MQPIDNIKTIYFLGIGGIGMSALARYFHSRGVCVSGYDKTPSPLTQSLQDEGIRVSHADDPAAIAGPPDLVVHTPAVPVTTSLYRHFKEHNHPIRKRSEVLGMLSNNTPTIAIAGTHGKTTIGAMLVHILKTAKIPCIAFLGGISNNYNSNYIGDPDPQWLIAEADEYDRSFLHLSPQIASISAIDADHLDVYGSVDALLSAFALFANRLPPEGILIAAKGIAEKTGFKGTHYVYHPEGPADYYLDDVFVHRGMYHANIRGRLTIDDVYPGLPGRHNIENALAAAAIAHQLNIGADTILSALNSFRGVHRRFDIRIQNEHIVYVDDYAHHPEEIKACIKSAREMWPGRQITGIFQPHLFSRTRDLAGQFAESLSLLDEVILLDIYPAREEPIEGVDAHMLLNKIGHTRAIYCHRDELLHIIEKTTTDILLSMGAGDIDRFAKPITQVLLKKTGKK